jgi:hypothetical protein
MNILSFAFGFGLGIYVGSTKNIDLKKDFVTIEKGDEGKTTTLKIFGVNIVHFKNDK